MAEASADTDAGASDDEAYDGLFGAVPYAFRSSRSRMFRAYAVVGVFAAFLVTTFMVLALVRLFGATASARGGSLTLSRAFYVVVGLLLVGPLLAPVLLVARHHRREGSRKRYDAGLGSAGFVFLAALYIGLIITVPAAYQSTGGGDLVEFLYSLPRVTGFVPPILAAALIALVHRLAG